MVTAMDDSDHQPSPPPIAQTADAEDATERDGSAAPSIAEEATTVVEWVRRARRGEAAAQEQIYLHLRPMFDQVSSELVRRFCNVSYETIRQKKLDILQHISFRFMEEIQDSEGILARWRPEHAALEIFLRPFAKHRGIEFLRKQKRHIALSYEELLATVSEDLVALTKERQSGQPDVESRELLRKLGEEILRDPELGQDAWRLLERVFFDEEDRRQIAASLGLKPNTLDRRIKRLRDTLLGLGRRLGLSFEQRDKRPGSRPAAKGTPDTATQASAAMQKKEGTGSLPQDPQRKDD